MDNESPEVIEQQMEETRQSLTDKVSALETQVVGTVQTATQAVQDTVETVKAAVQDTVTSVKDSVQESVTAVTDNVKETFDVTHHVEEHPYLMVGGALVAGLITGLLVFRKDESRSATIADAPLAYPPDFNGTPVREREPERNGFIDELLSMAGIEGKQLAREAVNQAAQAVRQHVMPTLLNWMTQRIETVFDRPATPAAAWETPERTYARR
jgi:ElaB/YqjD/DUF883 family membrane-anchored ribosome-binding protein